MLNFITNYKGLIKIASLVAIFLGLVLIVLSFQNGQESQNNTEKIKPQVSLLKASELKQEGFKIEATGEVKALDRVDLKSEVSAKVSSISVGLDDSVFAGQTLVVFQNDDLNARLLQAEAGVEAAEAQLAQLKAGAKQEDINSAETGLANAKRSLETAQKNLENTREQARENLESAYSGVLNSLRGSSESAKQTLVSLSEIQYSHFQDNSQTSLTIQSAKAEAMKYLFDVSGAGNWTASYVNQTDSGLYKQINNLQAIDFEAIDSGLAQIKKVLEATKRALNLVPLNKLTASENLELSNLKNGVNSQISAVSSAKQSIENQKTANQSLVSNAESAVVNAENAVKSAEAQLQSIKSGATSDQIAAQEAQVKSALANLYQIRSQLNKTVIRSPIGGKVASLSVNRGELVSMGQSVVSIVNNNALEVEAYLGPREASLVKKGDGVKIGENNTGVVNRVASSINPQSRKVEVQILIQNPEDSNLIVGEFVNLNFMTQETKAPGAYLIPLSAVRNKADNGAAVLIVENGKVVEKSVELGDIKGERVEVIGGIKDEDEIIESVRGLKTGQEVRVDN